MCATLSRVGDVTIGNSFLSLHKRLVSGLTCIIPYRTFVRHLQIWLYEMIEPDFFDSVGDVPDWHSATGDFTGLFNKVMRAVFDGAADAVEDISEATKRTFSIPMMLYNIMIAEMEQVHLLQRQNDMINESQEASTNDLVTGSVVFSGAGTQAIYPAGASPTSSLPVGLAQAMILRGFKLSILNAGIATLQYTGPKTLGSPVILSSDKLSANTPLVVPGLAQIIPAGSVIQINCAVATTVSFMLDIRPIVRYKDMMFRTQANRGLAF